MPETKTVGERLDESLDAITHARRHAPDEARLNPARIMRGLAIFLETANPVIAERHDPEYVETIVLDAIVDLLQFAETQELSYMELLGKVCDAYDRSVRP